MEKKKPQYENINMHFDNINITIYLPIFALKLINRTANVNLNIYLKRKF